MMELLVEAEGALSLGLLDRAETLYRRVEAADPRSSIAVVGLARVALERRNEPEALELARRAQAIDPENTSAQRMVRRLEEVLAFRGTELPPERSDSAVSTRVPIAGSRADATRLEPHSDVQPEPGPATVAEPVQGMDLSPTPAAAPRRRSLVDRLRRRS